MRRALGMVAACLLAASLCAEASDVEAVAALLRGAAAGDASARAQLVESVARSPATGLKRIDDALAQAYGLRPDGTLSPGSERLEALVPEIVAEGLAQAERPPTFGRALDELSDEVARGVVQGIARRRRNDAGQDGDRPSGLSDLAVLELLCEEGDPSVVREVFTALPWILEDLDDPWFRTLCDGLDDADAGVRAAAHQSLQMISRKAYPPERVRWERWWGLARDAGADLERLLRGLVAPSRHAQAAAREDLIRLLKTDPDTHVLELNDLADEALDTSNDPATLASHLTDVVVEAMSGASDRDPFFVLDGAPACLAVGLARGVRWVALHEDRTLSRYERHESCLFALAEREEPEVREAAFASLPACLDRLDDAWARILLDALESPNPGVSKAAWLALSKLSALSLPQSPKPWRDWWNANNGAERLSRGGGAGLSGTDGADIDPNFRWGTPTRTAPAPAVPAPPVDRTFTTVAVAGITLILLTVAGAILTLRPKPTREAFVVELAGMKRAQEERVKAWRVHAKERERRTRSLGRPQLEPHVLAAATSPEPGYTGSAWTQQLKRLASGNASLKMWQEDEATEARDEGELPPKPVSIRKPMPPTSRPLASPPSSRALAALAGGPSTATQTMMRLLDDAFGASFEPIAAAKPQHSEIDYKDDKTLWEEFQDYEELVSIGIREQAKSKIPAGIEEGTPAWEGELHQSLMKVLRDRHRRIVRAKVEEEWKLVMEQERSAAQGDG